MMGACCMDLRSGKMRSVRRYGPHRLPRCRDAAPGVPASQQGWAAWERAQELTGGGARVGLFSGGSWKVPESLSLDRGEEWLAFLWGTERVRV